MLPALYDIVRHSTALPYPVAATFINKKNKRSYAAHVRKLKFSVIDSFGFNQNEYYRLAFKMENGV